MTSIVVHYELIDINYAMRQQIIRNMRLNGNLDCIVAYRLFDILFSHKISE